MQNESRRIKAVFFDLGYTLIYFSGDFNKIISDSYFVLADELIKAGCRVDRWDFSRKFDQEMKKYYQQREIDFLERPVEKIIKEILKRMDQDHFADEVYVQAMYAMYRVTERSWLLEEDTIQTLQKLTAEKYRLALISNASNAWDVNNLIDNNHLRGYFSTILISANEGIRKPDPRIFARAAQKLQIDLSEAVMVGDTLDADILGAHRSGIKAIWISRRKDKSYQPDEVSSEMQPDAEIQTLTELPELLTQWNEQ